MPEIAVNARRNLRTGRGTAATAGLLLVAACSAASPPAAHDVDIRAFRYLPDTLTVAVGDTVVWRNHDPVPHTATGPGERWDTGRIDPGGERRWIADASGTAEYVCAYHPNMRATLVVRTAP